MEIEEECRVPNVDTAEWSSRQVLGRLASASVWHAVGSRSSYSIPPDRNAGRRGTAVLDVDAARQSPGWNPAVVHGSWYCLFVMRERERESLSQAARVRVRSNADHEVSHGLSTCAYRAHVFAWNTEAEPRRRLLHGSSYTACAPTCGLSVHTARSDSLGCRFSFSLSLRRTMSEIRNLIPSSRSFRELNSKKKNTFVIDKIILSSFPNAKL